MPTKIFHIIPASNFEFIRDQVACIVKDELDRQAEYYEEEDLTGEVFVERYTPIGIDEDNVITVNSESCQFDDQTNTSQSNEIHFNIDVFANAKQTSTMDGYKASSLKMQRVCGLIRSILMNPEYLTLGFDPGFIWHRSVQTIRFNRVMEEQDGSFSRMSRLDLLVKCSEEQQQATPRIAKGYDTQIKIELTEKGYKLIKNK